jgi:hypothetical protein
VIIKKKWKLEELSLCPFLNFMLFKALKGFVIVFPVAKDGYFAVDKP